MTRFEIPQPTEPSKLFTETRWLLSQLAWYLSEKILKVEPLSEESLANLQKIDDLLAEKSGIFYMNHVHEADVAAVAMALKHLRNARNLLGPAGLKHFDVERDKRAAYFYRMMRHLHVTFLPVLQHNDKERSIYTPDEIALISNQLRVLSQEALSSPGNIVGYTPEGTRNSDNVLTRARNGIGRNEQYHKPDETFYVPVALLYPPHTQKIEMSVGSPFFLPEILDLEALPEGTSLENAKQRADSITDALMRTLAALLPEENRGYYRTTNE